MERPMRACEQEMPSNRSPSTARSSCSPSGGREDLGRSVHRGGGSSHSRSGQTCQPFAAKDVMNPRDRQEQEIGLHALAFHSSHTHNGRALGSVFWKREEIPVRVRKFGETTPGVDEKESRLS